MPAERPETLSNGTIEEITQAIARIMARQGDPPSMPLFVSGGSPPAGSPPTGSPPDGGTSGSFTLGVTIDGRDFLLSITIPTAGSPPEEYKFTLEEGSPLAPIVKVTYIKDGPWSVTVDNPAPIKLGGLTINTLSVHLNGG